ncbi:MAG: crossover junction endodeoxyribonuclease RuvC [Eggerthellaceae bacterium]|nr:crossover junction endodeoxyribonuclease RuvC [Eggerthellaceae bacterium]
MQRTVLGIDPGLAHTGWGVLRQDGGKLSCVAYGCVATDGSAGLAVRLRKISDQIGAVVARYGPTCLGIESVWFGDNTTSAFATGQARGAALVPCAGLDVAEFTPRQIKLAVVGTGTAEKDQVAYMVQQVLGLPQLPTPDHAADALAAALCYTANNSVLAGTVGLGA